MASANALLRELEPLMPDRAHTLLAAGQNPFTGLAAFQESDADRFFGRTDDIASVVARVRSKPLVAVVGRDNMIGTQFHPEKSQAVGLRLIADFLAWKP